MTVDDKIPIKPFLSPVPEVRIFDLQRNLNALTDRDVLILASDGLWDVLTNDDAAAIVRLALSTEADDVDERSKFVTFTLMNLLSRARFLQIYSRRTRTCNCGTWQSDRNWSMAVDEWRCRIDR